MNIQPTSLAALTWAGAAAGTSAPSWRIGTVLSARPLGVTPQGMAILQIGALTVEAEVAGDSLPAQFQVRVLSMGTQPLLEMLSSGSPDPTFQRVLRERLPQQNGYAPLLATLSALSQRPMMRQLPPDLRTVLALLEQAIPTAAEITQGEGLRQAILNSGLFFEATLAQSDAPGTMLENDWKGALLRILGVLDKRETQPVPFTRSDTPPPLLKRGLQAQARASLPLPMDNEDAGPLLDRLHDNVKAAVARVEVAQMEASALPAWMIEIPVQAHNGSDVLQLHLEFAEADADVPGEWTLGFALDLPELGPVQGELQLRAMRLSVRLWAERTHTVQRLERQFNPLRQQLAACGLLLDQLSCQLGHPEPRGSYSAVLLQATA